MNSSSGVPNSSMPAACGAWPASGSDLWPRRPIDDPQLKAFKWVVGRRRQAGRSVARRLRDRAGLKVSGIFAIEAGTRDPGFLPYREADERGAPAAGAATRAAGEPRGLNAAGGQTLVFDRGGGKRIARQDRESFDPRPGTDPAGPARFKKIHIAPTTNVQEDFETHLLLRARGDRRRRQR